VHIIVVVVIAHSKGMGKKNCCNDEGNTVKLVSSGGEH